MDRKGRDWDVSDSYIFDGKRSRQGYNLNKMCISFTKPDNRAAFLFDEEAYMTKYGLSEEHKEAARKRDWLRLIQLGGNIYFIMKMGFVLKQGLYSIGAQQRGETLEEFLNTRNEKGAV